MFSWADERAGKLCILQWRIYAIEIQFKSPPLLYKKEKGRYGNPNPSRTSEDKSEHRVMTPCYSRDYSTWSKVLALNEYRKWHKVQETRQALRRTARPRMAKNVLYSSSSLTLQLTSVF